MMTPEERIKAERFKQEQERASVEAFNKFMNAPMTRLAISLIPSSPEHKETLETLLKATFNAGFDAGTGAFAFHALSTILDKKKF